MRATIITLFMLLTTCLVLAQEAKPPKGLGDKVLDETQKGAEKIQEHVEEQIEKFKTNDTFGNLALRAGPGLSRSTVNALNGTEDHFNALGFNTHFGYLTRRWEVNLSSYVHFGKIDGLHFTVGNNQVEADGSFRTMFFAPMFKYVTEITPKTNWNLYFTAGSVQSIKLAPFTDHTGVARPNHRINYESRGGIIGIGMQEMLPFKKMHPVYVEFLYSYVRAYRMTLVDTSDFKEVNTVEAEDTSFKVFDSLFMVNLGLLLF